MRVTRTKTRRQARLTVVQRDDKLELEVVLSVGPRVLASHSTQTESDVYGSVVNVYVQGQQPFVVEKRGKDTRLVDLVWENWDEDLIHDILFWEQDCSEDEILAVPSRLDREDVLAWHFDTNGVDFSVKSADHACDVLELEDGIERRRRRIQHDESSCAPSDNGATQLRKKKLETLVCVESEALHVERVAHNSLLRKMKSQH